MTIYHSTIDDITCQQMIVGCDCGQFDHQVMLSYYCWDDDDQEIILEFRLCPGGFLHRLKQAIKHVFGWRSRYGDYDEVVINKEDAQEIITFLERCVETDRILSNDDIRREITTFLEGYIG